MVAEAQGAPVETPAEFLDRLTGQWELTGQMGTTPLRQAVAARWVLGGLFVELYFRSTLPPQEGRLPYEALYHIGYSTGAGVYVMHLLDTFGVNPTCITGTGKRDGNSIPFVFNYSSGPFTNRFTWEPAGGEWTMLQTYLDGDTLRTFATKRMKPVLALT